YKKIEVSGVHKGERYRDDIALYQASLNDLRPNQKYFIECPDGSKVIPPCTILDEVMREGDGRWRWTKERYERDKRLLVFKETSSSPLLDENGHRAKYNVYTKSYLSERQETGTLPRNIWTDFINRKGADLLKRYGIPFDFSKPVELLLYMIKIANVPKDAVILDYFSGSATTAHAVMQLNAEDGGKRKFIMVQLPEKCDEKSEAYKAGYKNICEIGKERIRRAGKKIKEENGLTAQNLDTGFRVLKLDSSNMKDVYYKPSDYTQSLLDSLESNIKEDRTPLDLLFQVMLDLGKPLSAKIEEKEIAGKHVYIVNEDDLIACFDDGITEEVVKEIAKKKPLFAVFRDSGLSSDSTSTNFDQIFATYSPATTRRVL
ncbi:MAG: site-specific DNA-methyltransferase, partial [Clostridia bacterium]|nr:site-specific DNA-methyltransferase [Clostridia bacterium]